MGHFKKTFLPILITGIWINLSETIKWIFLIKSYWVEHFEDMGLTLPDDPINGIVWMIWGFLLATIIVLLSKKFNVLYTTLLAWFSVFVMIWLTLWNIGVLPTSMLWYNVPLSLIEVLFGVLICKKLLKTK